ncbi:hypothetical protein [Sphingobium sp. WCS2017Hpa-17]|uniref:hypothetical protein n=1 Tax=Sphingobium sp. WCS2017Hpa-17 TaxID=3073638 RepID=UPI0028893321|nr:hypothetical protein [Sphingobium sp. WCS2017Hpa-17]
MSVKVDPVYGALRAGPGRAVPFAAAPLDDLAALKAAMPVPSAETPMPEAVGGAAGIEGTKVSGAGHQHPRLTSTTGPKSADPTSHVIAASGLATVTFTRTFDLPPGLVFCEVPPATGSMPAQPATFRVESWVREVMTPTPSGKYIGCVVRGWRSQALPTLNALSLTAILTAVVSGVNGIVSALTGYNVFGASASGTAFTCIAVARSDA